MMGHAARSAWSRRRAANAGAQTGKITWGASGSARTPGPAAGAHADAEVHLAATGIDEAHLGVDADPNRGVRGAEARQAPDQPARGEDRRDRDGEAVVALRRGLGHRRGEVGEAAAQERVDLAGVLARGHAGGRPIEERAAEDRLGADDLLAHRAGRHAQVPGGGAQASQPRDRLDGAKGGQGHAVEGVRHAARLYPRPPIRQCAPSRALAGQRH
jgi:hypothetical protein